jgi:multidrug efflux pump subunit AcrB
MSLGAIRKWRILVVGAVGLLLVAWMAWLRIPRLEDPRIEPALVFVSIPYPGASAEDVEAQVVKPVEEELYGMDGVEFIESTAMPNYALLALKFEATANMETATEAVRGKVLGKRRDLPPEVLDPSVTRAKSATFTAQMVVLLVGNRADGVLTDAAKRLKDDFAGLPGVASVKLRGERTRAIRIRLDAARLAEHHMSVEEVVRRIKLSNVRVPGGEVQVGSFTTMLSVNHELRDAASVGRIVVGAAQDMRGSTHTVSLSDVAELHDDFRAPRERMMQDGLPAVGLEVRFRADENAVKVGAAVRAQLEASRAGLPQGLSLHVAHDQPAWVERSLSSFLESLLEGVCLVMLVITLGMGWRSAMVVALVIPLSIAGAVLGLFSMGFALEQVSIAGLIVALGLLVDDAVVVTESIELMRHRGLGQVRAAVLGTARVFWANTGTTAVACAAFVPLFFLSGDTGAFIRGLPMAVVLSLVTSLIVAQLFTPWVSTFLLKRPKGVPSISDAVPFDRAEDLSSEGGERNAPLRAVKAGYAFVIPWVVENPLKVIGVATAMLIGSVLLLPHVGVQFFPKADKPVVFVTVELPRGSDDTATAAKVIQVLAVLRKDPEVVSTSAVIGAAYPQIFLGRASRPPSKHFGDVLVRLSTHSSTAAARRLRAALAWVPGVRVQVEELYIGPPIPHPITIRVQGDDYATLRGHADQIKSQLRRVPGAINVSDTLSDSIPLANVEVDADRALRLGVTPAQVGGALRALYGGDKITTFRQGLDTVELLVEPADTQLSTLAQVGETPIPSLLGNSVPVLAASEVSITRGYAQLRRRNARRIVEITADVSGGTLPSDVLKQLQPSLERMKWAPGYGFSVAGEQAETEASFKNLGIAAAGALLLVFSLLVLMFESITRSVIVLLAVPYALIGAITGLYITGTPFGFMAFLGLIALIGVYVNHKIYFVDRLQELTHRGMPFEQAIYQAGIDRLRPVVLTALTAILGLLPLTLSGGVFWAAFGWVNIFGLITSIPLSLLLLPALLAFAHRLRHGRTSRVERAPLSGSVNIEAR